MAKDSGAEVGGRAVGVAAETVKGVGKIVKALSSGRRHGKLEAEPKGAISPNG
jgi:hypothetical protein